MPITRREVLGLISSGTYLLTASSSPLAALAATDTPEETLGTARFPQGVASGDPQSHSVMLWTRAEPVAPASGRVNLIVELSRDESFTEILLSSAVSCGSDMDYTLRTHVENLAPSTSYYYRFRGAEGSISRTGRTRTAPKPEAQEPANIAFASCQSYEQAYYGSWARMLEDDKKKPAEEQIDFVLHLGDFIYERCWNTQVDGSALSRRVPDFPDGVESEKYRYAHTLADYRHLYKLYLSDPYLQEARARWPFVCTWDDHEFANDNYQSYSTYGEEKTHEPQRKQWSNQAWFEFIPAILNELEGQPAKDFSAQELGKGEANDNQAALDSLKIYRKLQWGQLIDIVITDERSYRSPACMPDGFAESLGLPINSVTLVEIMDAGSAYNGGNPPEVLPYGEEDIANPAKTRPPGSILGAEQKAWFLQTLEQSSAQWKLWANALPILPMRLDLSTLPLTGYEDSIFTLDSWAGYPYEVKQLTAALEEKAISGLVSLSGDHHMHGAGTVSGNSADPEARPVMADFNIAGISSAPLLDEVRAVADESDNDFRTLVYQEDGDSVIPVWNMSMIDGALSSFVYDSSGMRDLSRWLGPNEANHGLKYVDVDTNGYGLARFGKNELKIQLVAMTDCRTEFVEAPAIHHVAHFTLPNWGKGEDPAINGPKFEGQPPFPYSAD
jgi:alkaline phosphatase D